MQQGQVVALYNYMAQMIVELIKLASLIITLNKSAACAGRVADILKVKSTMDYPSSSTYSAQISKDLATATADASLSENAIVFNDVTFDSMMPAKELFCWMVRILKITPEVISAPESALFHRRQLFSKALSGTI